MCWVVAKQQCASLVEPCYFCVSARYPRLQLPSLRVSCVGGAAAVHWAVDGLALPPARAPRSEAALLHAMHKEHVFALFRCGDCQRMIMLGLPKLVPPRCVPAALVLAGLAPQDLLLLEGHASCPPCMRLHSYICFMELQQKSKLPCKHAQSIKVALDGRSSMLHKQLDVLNLAL